MIRYRAPHDGRVKIEVFDLTGRVVFAHEADISTGLQQWIWDGRNWRGESLCSGTYFYRMQFFGSGLTTVVQSKMLLLR